MCRLQFRDVELFHCEKRLRHACYLLFAPQLYDPVFCYILGAMGISFGAGQRLFFFGLLVVVTFFFLWMIRGFIFPIFWAVVFALLLHPAYLWFCKRIGKETLSALLVMLAALLLIVLPIAWLGTQIGQEAFAFYRSLAESGGFQISIPAPALDSLASLGVDVVELKANLAGWAQTAISWIISESLMLGSATFNIVLKTLLMLYLLFFFLRDGELLGHYIMRRLPLGDRKEKALFQRFATTTRAIMKGTVFSAVAQGIVGGIIFAIAGIENATLWGAVMALLAIIPAVGPGLVWLPAGLILIGTGSLVPALIVLIGGAAVVSPLDNLLRPMLVGRETEMPDALILLSILGGIGAFGIAGVIVGPVVAALAMAVWDIFAEEYEAELSAQG